MLWVRKAREIIFGVINAGNYFFGIHTPSLSTPILNIYNYLLGEQLSCIQSTNERFGESTMFCFDSL